MRRLATVLAVALLCSAGSAQTVTERLLPPGTSDFFKGAVRTQGALPAIISTADYMTRSGRIGSAQHHSLLPATPGNTATGFAAPTSTGPTDRYVSKDFEFVNYLIGNNMEKDAVVLLTRGHYHPSDTLQYLRGWADYSAKRLDEASAEFDLVPKDSPFHDKSLFFNVVSNAHAGKYGRSAELLRGYDGPYKELWSLEEAGIALLEGRASDFVKASGNFTYSQYALTEAEHALKGIYDDRTGSKSKSPWVAAAASAVIPGLGKVYAGELAEGVSAFLTIGSLAAITAENWIRYGFKDWKTLLFGAVGTVFYIGNIYGSYVSVSIHNNDLKNAQDTAILYHIHIPLRSVFQ